MQRSSNGLDPETLEKRITRYHPRYMAGSCANSAKEVGAVLGSACLGYVVAVYRDESGEVRNHIAAVGSFDGRTLVADATWKQFPFLSGALTAEVRAKPLVLVCSVEEWQAMIARYTRGIDDERFSQEDDFEEATQWMRDRRRDLTQVAPGPTKKQGRGCTLF